MPLGYGPDLCADQPSALAAMLEQLDVRPGHQVLLVGSGNRDIDGYLTALIGHLTGPTGGVAWADRPPYDRVLVTKRHLNRWFELVPGGRLVRPVEISGMCRTVSVEADGDRWVSRSIRPVNFVSMQQGSALALLTDGDIVGPDLSRRDHRATGLTITPAEVVDGLSLWLELRHGGWSSTGIPYLMETVRVMSNAGTAALFRRTSGEIGVLVQDCIGGRLADQLCDSVREWDAAGRPGSADLRLTWGSHRVQPELSGRLVEPTN
ncbi:hypothetical protein GCM10009765_11090 [Fodinicola feengrottensis]|uniref:Uncharacterized protein n=1 Tax=Fodinicola feengrottensis TaxID=435914 RepID=A0ABN2G0V0_9ACTN